MTYIVIRRPYGHLEDEVRRVFAGREDVKVVVDRRAGSRDRRDPGGDSATLREPHGFTRSWGSAGAGRVVSAWRGSCGFAGWPPGAAAGFGSRRSRGIRFPSPPTFWRGNSNGRDRTRRGSPTSPTFRRARGGSTWR